MDVCFVVGPLLHPSSPLNTLVCMLSCAFISPNFYILDEPTNHLDMETIEALAKALNKFKVSISLTSIHNFCFVLCCCSRNE